MVRSVSASFALVLTVTMLFAAPAWAECTSLGAPQIASCKPVDVSAIAKSYLDLYRIESGKPVFDRSLKKSDICLPFKATDCGVPGYLMIETADHTRLVFRTADLKDAGATCTCDRAGQTTVAGAPGAGKPNVC